MRASGVAGQTGFRQRDFAQVAEEEKLGAGDGADQRERDRADDRDRGLPADRRCELFAVKDVRQGAAEKAEVHRFRDRSVEIDSRNVPSRSAPWNKKSSPCTPSVP